MFTKRHYRNGYYVDYGSKKSSNKRADEKVSKEEFKQLIEDYEVHIVVATHAVFYHDFNLE